MSRQKSSPTKSRHSPITRVTQSKVGLLEKRTRRTKQKGPERLIARLEDELARTREELKALTAEQETTSEELRSFNEELQTTNEQLVARTNQLQSSNEDLVRLNEELSHSNADLSNLLNSIRIPIVMLREDLRIGRFTPMAAELFRLKPEDIGRPLRDNSQKIQIPGLQGLVKKVMDTFDTQEHEIQDREGHCGISADISERRKSEDALATHARELARSNAELTRFAYVASHDLQEPLRMISLYTQLLAKRYHGKLDADVDEFIAYVIGGTGRMHQLINDLLTYSQVSSEVKQFEPTDCDAIMKQVLAHLAVTVEQLGADVTYDQLPKLQTDCSQLRLLFRNLLENALKYHGHKPIRVQISAEREGRDWQFWVRDKGIGIDPQYAERIFITFQRLHNHSEYPGTGIGLAICKRVVERHGGKIWVESPLGQGATFHFTLSAEDQRSSRRLT